MPYNAQEKDVCYVKKYIRNDNDLCGMINRCNWWSDTGR